MARTSFDSSHHRRRIPFRRTSYDLGSSPPPAGSLGSSPFDASGSKWEAIWGRGLPAGSAFDRGESAPILSHLLTSGIIDAHGKRVVVPGCGRGYDLVTFARHGASATGIELAPSAVAAANDHIARELGPASANSVAAATGGVSVGTAMCLHGNFLATADADDNDASAGVGVGSASPLLSTPSTSSSPLQLQRSANSSGFGSGVASGASSPSSASAQTAQQGQQQLNTAVAAAEELVECDGDDDSSSGGGNGPTASSPLYDVGYDYYFLSALSPSWRARWAEAWARAIAPGGLLVTVLYPLPAAAADGVGGAGPPYALLPSDYAELLEPAGFEPVLSEPVPPSLSLPGRERCEHLVVWRRCEGAAEALPDAAASDDDALLLVGGVGSVEGA